MKVIVPSCYDYRQCWQPWLYFFHKHWPEPRPEPVLLTDTSDESAENFTTWGTGPDAGFCENLHRYLVSFNFDPFLYLILDDHWLCGDVDLNHLREAHTIIEEGIPEIGAFRLHPSPGPSQPLGNSQWFGEAFPGTKYRISTAPTLWRRSYLLRLLDLLVATGGRKSEQPTAWDFELLGSLFSTNLEEKILASHLHVIPFWNSAIVRGKWHPNVVENARLAGATINTSDRDFLPIPQQPT